MSGAERDSRVIRRSGFYSVKELLKNAQEVGCQRQMVDGAGDWIENGFYGRVGRLWYIYIHGASHENNNTTLYFEIKE